MKNLLLKKTVQINQKYYKYWKKNKIKIVKFRIKNFQIFRINKKIQLKIKIIIHSNMIVTKFIQFLNLEIKL